MTVSFTMDGIHCWIRFQDEEFKTTKEIVITQEELLLMYKAMGEGIEITTM